MVGINCTLIIQALNFGVACWVFGRLLFRPVLEALKQDLDERQEVADSAGKVRSKISKKEQTRGARLASYRQLFKDGSPDVVAQLRVQHVDASSIDIKMPSKGSMEKAADELVERVVKEVDHVG